MKSLPILPALTAALLLALAAAAPAAAESRTELLAAVPATVEPLPVPEATLPLGLRAYGLLPSQLVTVGSRVLFVADDREHGVEPWSTDGTAAGTGMVLDIVPGEGSSYPRTVGVVGGSLVFWATTAGGARTLWASDGTAGGTAEIAALAGHAPEVEAPPVGWFWWQAPAEPALLGGELFFTTSPGGECRLWATDGGAVRLVEHLPGGGCGRPLVSGGRVYFSADGTWRSTDGAAPSVPLEAPECPGGEKPSLRGVEPFDGGLALALRCLVPFARVALVAHGEPPRIVREHPGAIEIAADEAGLWMVNGDPRRGLLEVWHAAPDAPAEQVLERFGVTFQVATVFDGALLLGVTEIPDSWPHLTSVLPDGTVTTLADQPVSIEPGTVRRRGGELVFFSGVLNHLDGGPFRWDLWTTGGSPETTRRVATFTAPRQGPDGRPRGEIAPQLALLGGDVILAADDGGGQQLRALREEVVEPTACVPSPEVLCLGGDRFEARVRFRNPYVDPSEPVAAFGDASVRTDTADSGYFWFFRPGNLELLVKVLDGVGVNSHHWVFHGPMTTLEYWLQVTDAASGLTRTYRRPPGSRCGGADVTAFPPGPPPAEAAAAVAPLTPPISCDPTGGNVCLGAENRFQVSVTFRDHRNAPGVEQGASGEAESEDAASFWFFRPDNVEVLVKVLDGQPVNGHFWVFVGALTDLAFEVEVLDTGTGVRRTYDHPQGSLCGTADTMAF